MRLLRLAVSVILFIVLTILTQIGGLVYLLLRWLQRYTDRLTTRTWLQRMFRVGLFLVLYTVATFVVVPLLARPFGRVPLPFSTTRHLQPVTPLTWLLNRQYVRPALREAVYEVADYMDTAYPGTRLNYLDGNFPFFNGFPLFPHLSHNDGQKLDLAFCYKDGVTGVPVNESPSPIGYAVCEGPRHDEEDMPAQCADKGFWQYSLLADLVPQGGKSRYPFDAVRTKALAERLTAHPAIGKLFIEPHLKARLELKSPKVRFHGCRAVRHDDHIHIQLK
ncbi:hypothetical protein [Paraflavitalea pollutisoli]|uniref:hypothetical protein n=1 Tax=Paraflavitalea pollutisoli TaxID=3034143 RepID=UPI0023EB613A|nr:hypothetical protein [Paraflavitalea sp. H1-2-19X]